MIANLQNGTIRPSEKESFDETSVHLYDLLDHIGVPPAVSEAYEKEFNAILHFGHRQGYKAAIGFNA